MSMTIQDIFDAKYQKEVNDDLDCFKKIPPLTLEEVNKKAIQNIEELNKLLSSPILPQELVYPVPKRIKEIISISEIENSPQCEIDANKIHERITTYSSLLTNVEQNSSTIINNNPKMYSLFSSPTILIRQEEDFLIKEENLI
jgi:hypothetical protein